VSLSHAEQLSDALVGKMPEDFKGLSESSRPVLARFRAALLEIEAAELKRLYDRLPTLDERSKNEIEQFADRVVAGVLDPPLSVLRRYDEDDSTNRLIKSLQRLFQLA
jgi:glutamyl-tRNA reductase